MPFVVDTSKPDHIVALGRHHEALAAASEALQLDPTQMCSLHGPRFELTEGSSPIGHETATRPVFERLAAGTSAGGTNRAGECRDA
jgi:hypothetical protein